MGCSRCGKLGHNKLNCKTRMARCANCRKTGHNRTSCKSPILPKVIHPKTGHIIEEFAHKPIPGTFEYKPIIPIWDEETQKLRKGEIPFPENVVKCIQDLEENDELIVTEAAINHNLDYYNLIYYLYHYDQLWLNELMKRTERKLAETRPDPNKKYSSDIIPLKYSTPKPPNWEPVGSGYIKSRYPRMPKGYLVDEGRIGFVNVEEDQLFQIKKLLKYLSATKLGKILSKRNLIELSIEILKKTQEENDKPGYRRPFTKDFPEML